MMPLHTGVFPRHCKWPGRICSARPGRDELYPESMGELYVQCYREEEEKEK